MTYIQPETQSGEHFKPGARRISGGVASLVEDGTALTEVLGAADEALCVAKERGRNQVVVCNRRDLADEEPDWESEGVRTSTSWAEEKLYQIVVHRHEARLPTVITTVSTIDELEDTKSRIASRLVDGMVVDWQPISAPNYRDQRRRGG